jgi:hypothetical protein
MRGEIDARATSADTVMRRNPDWLKKDLVDFHAIIEVPKGEKHPTFPSLPELESFAKSEKDRKIMTMQRAFRVAGQPFVLPPGTPKDRLDIIQEGFRKTYNDPEFHKEYKKLTADDPPRSCLMPMREQSERFPAIRRSPQFSNRSRARGRCRRARFR